MKKEDKLEGDRKTVVDPSLIKSYILNETGKSMSGGSAEGSLDKRPLQKEPQISSSDWAKSQDTQQQGATWQREISKDESKTRRNMRGHKIMQSHMH